MTLPIEHAFHFCPRCAHKNTHVGDVPFRCRECNFAHFFGPVAAVGALIVNDAKELLLVKRARDPGKGMWGLPGGFVDRGETVEEAIAREVKEETQLVINSMRLMATKPNEYDYNGLVSAVIDLFYICQVESTVPIELEPTELCEAVWTVPSDIHLDNMAFASNRFAIELWLSAHR